MPPKGENQETHRKTTASTSVPFTDTIAGRHIPPDVVLDILARLPVKDVLRLKCVCKQLKTLTSDKLFISAHLSHSPSSLLFHAHLINFGGHCICSVTISPPEWTFTHILDYPGDDCEHFDRHLKVIGSLPNGVFCVAQNEYSDMLILWNPATRSSRWVDPPKLIPDPSIHAAASVGLGFDPTQKDIKIVRMLCHKGFGTPDLVEVYSHNSGTWTILDPKMIPKFCVSYYNCSTVFEGVPFWWCLMKEEDMSERIMLVSYIPKDGVFNLEPLNWIRREEIQRTVHGVREIMGCLAVVTWDIFGEEMNVWLRHEDFTWRRLYQVRPLPEIGRVLGFYGERGVVQEITRNGNIHVFDLQKKDDTQVLLSSHGNVIPGTRMVTYKESLTQIPVAGQGDQ